MATELPGVLLIEPAVHVDARGRFAESWHRDQYAAAGVPDCFVQDNVSVSRRGVLRGLHLQHPSGQAKLISVLHGSVFDVAVDVRRGSPTFGRWVGYTLSADNAHQLYIPCGFAHGFVATTDGAVMSYKVSAHRSAGDELTIAWDDPEIAVAWPVAAPTLSARDEQAPRLAELPAGCLPRYATGGGSEPRC